MAQDFVWIEARRHVSQLIVVLDLELGGRYLLPRQIAEQLLDAGVVCIAPAQAPKLEAAARAAPSRRG